MPETALPGRRAQAARNDFVILDAARQVFLVDPKAPITHVAERAGVGISALYRRYPSKEFLLCRLCHDGLRTYIAEAEAADEEPDGWAALTGFLCRVVDADVHSLTVHLAGTFTPTDEMGADARRANELSPAPFARARGTGRGRAAPEAAGRRPSPKTSAGSSSAARGSRWTARSAPPNCAAATWRCSSR